MSSLDPKIIYLSFGFAPCMFFNFAEAFVVVDVTLEA